MRRHTFAVQTENGIKFGIKNEKEEKHRIRQIRRWSKDRHLCASLCFFIGQNLDSL